jgi:hypothetical protein
VEEEEEKEEDSVYEEANNTATTSDNDNDNYSNNNNEEGDDDEAGYESWTEGNWCLLLPFPTAVENEIETAGPATASASRRSRVVVRNRSNEDYNTDTDNDDGNDDVASAKSSKKTYNKTRYEERWDEMFQRLVVYKKQHKSTNVPRHYIEDPKLGEWVQSQRTTYTQKTISVERIGRLDSIRFVWKMYDLVPWEKLYQRLVGYKNNHKSTNVPAKYKKDPKLGNWVRRQRQYYNNKTLSIERINRLELIGFVWNPCDVRWMEMYHKLMAYKKQNNSTKVPTLYTKDPSLGLWVSTQRKAYNNGKMTGKRLELLNTINFVWSMMKAS